MFSKPGTDHVTKFNIFYMIMPLSRKKPIMYFRRIPMDRLKTERSLKQDFEFREISMMQFWETVRIGRMVNLECLLKMC